MAHLEKYKATSVGHMHAAFTPILDGRFNFKKMCPRTFYQSLHKDLGDSEDELSRSLMASEERLDALRWQLRTSPESSGRGARG